MRLGRILLSTTAIVGAGMASLWLPRRREPPR